MVMALDGLHPMLPRIPPVPVHLERDVPRHGALPQCADQEVAELPHGPLDGRRARQPFLDIRRFGHGSLVGIKDRNGGICRRRRLIL